MTGAITNIGHYDDALRNQGVENPSCLDEKWQKIKDEQGVLGNAWNEIKEITTIGVSESDCESMVEKYNKGEISFDEAMSYIEDFEEKQKNGADLLANVATGVGAIATATIATAGGPIGWGLAAAKGAPIGAILKTGIKTFDRATNDVEGDELDTQLMIEDSISGAMTGATSAVTSGVGEGVKNAKMALSVSNGVKCGAVCGTAAGAASYLTDVAFDEEKPFEFGSLVKCAAKNGFVSGTVGGIVGAGIYGKASLAGAIGQQGTKTTAETIISDATASSLRKLGAAAENNVFAA